MQKSFNAVDFFRDMRPEYLRRIFDSFGTLPFDWEKKRDPLAFASDVRAALLAEKEKGNALYEKTCPVFREIFDAAHCHGMSDRVFETVAKNKVQLPKFRPGNSTCLLAWVWLDHRDWWEGFMNIVAVANAAGPGWMAFDLAQRHDANGKELATAKPGKAQFDTFTTDLSDFLVPRLDHGKFVVVRQMLDEDEEWIFIAYLDRYPEYTPQFDDKTGKLDQRPNNEAEEIAFKYDPKAKVFAIKGAFDRKLLKTVATMFVTEMLGEEMSAKQRGAFDLARLNTEQAEKDLASQRGIARVIHSNIIYRLGTSANTFSYASDKLSMENVLSFNDKMTGEQYKGARAIMGFQNASVEGVELSFEFVPGTFYSQEARVVIRKRDMVIMSPRHDEPARRCLRDLMNGYRKLEA